MKFIQHYSARIPWKDNDYSGRVDNYPQYNVSAQVISRIASYRDLDFEEANRGKHYKQSLSYKMQNWIKENAAFMSPTSLQIIMRHPYKSDPKFKHYLDTPFNLDPYSFLLIPFSWTSIRGACEKHKYYNFSFDIEKTKQMRAGSGSWVSEGHSQKGILNYFFSGIEPHKSLIFPYYKQVPFIEDNQNRRVIAGIGNIVSNTELKLYRTDGSSEEINYIWQTNAAHSIRDGGKDGFLMPYHEIAEYAKINPDFDVSTVTVFEPDGFKQDFSYLSEWVSHDAAIDALEQTKKALKNIANLSLRVANQGWVNTQLKYVDNQLENAWNLRGVFPGIGAVLSAFGVQYGFDIAKYIDSSINDVIVDLILFFFGTKLTGDKDLDNSLASKKDKFFDLLKDEINTQYFELLASMDLSIDQAYYAWSELKAKSKEIILNPYLLYEFTREEKNQHQIAISQIDNAIFVNPKLNIGHHCKQPFTIDSSGDPRRLRAIITYVLDQAAEQGHTFLSYEHLLAWIKGLPLAQRTDSQAEEINKMSGFLEEGALYVNSENSYIKLKKYQECKKIIADIVNCRLRSGLPAQQNWTEIIDQHYGDLQKNNEENDRKARVEKALALKNLELSKISILLGKAGTGKTSALGIFSSVKEIKSGGVLALTPTGKARVQLENTFKNNNANAVFMTVAQFLSRSEGFDTDKLSYELPTKSSTSKARTVIIDESSMLTEVMFAGILKLIDSHADRIIFTGDENQLPPIGAGRPFVDLISYFESNHPEKIAKLETEMRQGSGGDDLSFAQIFSNSKIVDKDVVARIYNKQTDDRFKFIQYSGLLELEEVFLKELLETAGMASVDDIDGFNRSLGAEINGSETKFHTGKHIEDWQILSPTKFLGIGSYYINNQIHRRFRQDIVKNWNDNRKYGLKPQSTQNIVLGDKIISNVNEQRYTWNNSCEYIANGEIGILSFARKNDPHDASYSFRFASFEGELFSYTKKDFGNDINDSKLELAYALTTHKSQGSGFGKTIVIINGKNPLISKELLYTAFSRQKDKLTIISDLPIKELLQYSSDWYSNTKQRFTDLFEIPQIIEIKSRNQKRYFEGKLINSTEYGEMLRTKSDVIVANLLKKLNVEYSYEQPIEINGKFYIPDFTLRYQEKTAFFELPSKANEAYRRHWKKKKENYNNAGISEANVNLIVVEAGFESILKPLFIEEKIRAWMKNKRMSSQMMTSENTKTRSDITFEDDKDRRFSASNDTCSNKVNTGSIEPTIRTRRYKKITAEMIIEVWESFMKHYQFRTPISELSADLAARTGMNRKSAAVYLNFLFNLVNANQQTRVIKMNDLEFFMAKIQANLGEFEFQNALRSLQRSIPFWRDSLTGKFSDKIEDYLKKLNK